MSYTVYVNYIYLIDCLVFTLLQAPVIDGGDTKFKPTD